VQAYLNYLLLRAPEQHNLFRGRLKNNPDGASAEAAVFSWLRAEKLSPSVNEKPGQTGADFKCLPTGHNPFLVEVTCLNSIAVTNQSHWLDKTKLDEVAHHLNLITPQLAVKADDKTRQLSAAATGNPGVLAICLVHPIASILLSTLAAKWLLASEPTIRIPISASGERVAPAQTVTDLRHSVFLAECDGAIIPVRQSISAILLIALWNRQSDVVGLLHPKPITAFDHRILPQVPFLRLVWPTTASLEMEWLIGYPLPHKADHYPVALTADELAGK
jgi:hypothetical protein